MRWSDVPTSRFAKEYREHARVHIPHVLPSGTARQLQQSMQDLDDGNVWYHAQRGTPRFTGPEGEYCDHDFHYRFDKYPLANIGLKALVGAVGDSRRPDYRDLLEYGDNPERELPEAHPLVEFARFLNSATGTDLVSAITGHSLPEQAAVCFASRYSAGDYLSIHDDSDPRSERLTGFVLGLSEGWQHHWGGQTVYFDRDHLGAGEARLPSFNSLTLFEVPMHHCVLPVSPYCRESRYSISGWFYSTPRAQTSRGGHHAPNVGASPEDPD